MLLMMYFQSSHSLTDKFHLHVYFIFSMICHAQTEQGFASTNTYLGLVSFKWVLQAGIIYNKDVDLDPVMKHFLSAFFTNNTGTTLLDSRSGMPFP